MGSLNNASTGAEMRLWLFVCGASLLSTGNFEALISHEFIQLSNQSNRRVLSWLFIASGLPRGSSSYTPFQETVNAKVQSRSDLMVDCNALCAKDDAAHTFNALGRRLSL
jgi:hypothetical protein